MSLLRQAVETIEAGILVLDEHGGLLYWNDYARALLVAEDPSSQLTKPSISELWGPLEALLREPVSELRTLDGRYFGYRISAFEDEGYRRYAVLFQDLQVTREEREACERALQFSVVSGLLPSLLHELRNPLAAISGMIELMIEECDSHEIQKDLHAILHEVRRAHLSLQGLGAAERSLLSDRYHAVDLALEGVVRILEQNAQHKGVILRSQIDVMPLLPLDEASVRSIAMNLLSNAWQACTPGDEVLLTARVEAQIFILIVRDNGPGMAPQTQERCTSLFFTTKPKGTGIGLALCKRLVEGAGGKLEIESTQGQGTTFRVLVPLRAPSNCRC